MNIFKAIHIFILITFFSTQNILAISLSFPALGKNKENGEESVERKKISKHLIPLEIKDVKDDQKSSSTIYAKLRDTTQEGRKEGIDKMTLEGKVIDSKKSKSQNILTIVWQKAAFNKKKVEFETPLQSKIGVKDKIEEGDAFSAKGDSKDLLRVWNKLQGNDAKNSDSEKSNNLSSNNRSDNTDDERDNISSADRSSSGYLSSSGGTLGSNINGQTDFPEVTTDFSSEETVITADGCDIRIDLSSNMAIVQKRTLQGDSEVSPCSDSSDTYLIERSYGQCSNYVDYNEGKVFKQYILSYANPNAGGNIQVQDCTIDREQFVEIVDDYSKCGLQHNFKENLSIQQKRTVYVDSNDAEFILSNCHNTDKRYIHKETDNGCEDRIQDNMVIWSTRKYITVEGKDIYISECTPKDNNITIHEERCLSNPYTHNFVTNQSFLNKNYFYYKNNQKVLLQDCIKSEESINHQQEVGICEPIHDDLKKESILNYKTYIEDQGNKIFITDCIPSSTPIPYVKYKAKWIKQDTQTGKFAITTPNLDRLGYTNLGGNHNVSYDVNVDICYRNDLPDVWNLVSSGEGIDEASSDQFVQYDFRFANYGIKYGFMYRLYCGDPHCTAITDLNKFPIYTRFDGSEYIDESQVLSTKKICGFGHLIDGKEEGF
jgi:hypothetical protein